MSVLSQVRPPTGEPYAGDPHVRFGGRGHRSQSMLPTPMLTSVRRYNLDGLLALDECSNRERRQPSSRASKSRASARAWVGSSAFGRWLFWPSAAGSSPAWQCGSAVRALSARFRRRRPKADRAVGNSPAARSAVASLTNPTARGTNVIVKLGYDAGSAP